METLKVEDSTDLAAFDSAPARAELDYWEQLIFSFDMDREPAFSNGGRNEGNTRRSRPTTQTPTAATASSGGSSMLIDQDHNIFAQFADGDINQPSANSYDLLAQTLQGSQGFDPYIPSAGSFTPNFMPHGNTGQQHMQMLPQNYGWPQHFPSNPPQDQPDPLQYSHNYNPGTSQFFHGAPPQQQTLHIDTNTSTGSGTSAWQAVSSSTPSMSPAETTGENVSNAEDKRRRNTAASARFRTKKKQRSLNLERSVSDLTGRAEELEREASELRRENVWLKEIVMLKGRSLVEISQSGEGSGNRGGDSSGSDSDESDGVHKKKKGKGKKTSNK